jgi:hypothetical protein
MSHPDVISGARLDRRGVLVAGAGVAFGALALTGQDASAADVARTGWRFCLKCRGLFHSPGNDAAGTCPAGAKHKPRKAVNYVLYAIENPSVGDQWSGWWKCTKCAGLFLRFGSSQPASGGVCPRGGAHSGGGDPVVLWTGVAATGMMEDNWGVCEKCRGLFNFADGNLGDCPEGAEHDVLAGTVAKLVMIY